MNDNLVTLNCHIVTFRLYSNRCAITRLVKQESGQSLSVVVCDNKIIVLRQVSVLVRRHTATTFAIDNLTSCNILIKMPNEVGWMLDCNISISSRSIPFVVHSSKRRTCERSTSDGNGTITSIFYTIQMGIPIIPDNLFYVYSPFITTICHV